VDDHDRLLKLISLVAWTDGDHCGQRFANGSDEVLWRS
jgi:hypothetical protein